MSDMDDLTNPARPAGAGAADGVGAGAENAAEHPDLTRPTEPGSDATEADGSLGTEPDPVAAPQHGGGVDDTDEHRGNLDGSNAPDGPRQDSLDQARGNGSFEDATDASTPDTDQARMAADAGDSGQDNGSAG